MGLHLVVRVEGVGEGDHPGQGTLPGMSLFPVHLLGEFPENDRHRCQLNVQGQSQTPAQKWLECLDLDISGKRRHDSQRNSKNIITSVTLND